MVTVRPARVAWLALAQSRADQIVVVARRFQTTRGVAAQRNRTISAIVACERVPRAVVLDAAPAGNELRVQEGDDRHHVSKDVVQCVDGHGAVENGPVDR